MRRNKTVANEEPKSGPKKKPVTIVPGNPKLMSITLQDGRESLYLEYYFGSVREPVLDDHGEPVIYQDGDMAGMPKYKIKHQRRKENLNLYLLPRGTKVIGEISNRDKLELAKATRAQRELELLEDERGYNFKSNYKTNLLSHFDEFVSNARTADKRVLKCALDDFREFLKEEHPNYAAKITPNCLTQKMVQQFAWYLEDHHQGQGAVTYYKRFKRMVNDAVKNKIIRESPCQGIVIKNQDNELVKDILSDEEMKILFSTHYYKENKEIRRAFAFTCLTGIRRCDIVELKYSNVDFGNRRLIFCQHKTQGHSKHSMVVIPLNDNLLELIGKGDKDDYIFHLPTTTTCLLALRTWTERAGIKKHITWHCGRHSFATILLSNGANIKTVSNLLGHSSLTFTDKYVRAVDELKEKAINSLPDFKL